MLSRDRARREAAWDKLEGEFGEGKRVDGVIFGRVKGGFTVDLDGAVAFLPGSQVDIRPVRDVQPLMDIPQPFQILKMDRRRGNIVVSRRAVLEETRAEQRSGLIQNLAEGQIIDGVVKNITDYGAFVDLGGIDGLLHVTDMSYKRVNHPSEVINIGDTVQGADRPHQPRHAAHQPRHEAAGKRSVGRRCRQVPGRRQAAAARHQHHRIRRLRRTGSRASKAWSTFRKCRWTKKNVHPGKIVSTSQEVDVMVLEVDSDKRRISLGLKQAQQNPWEAFAEKHPVGSIVEGEVKNATEFGLFIGLDGDVDGMVHMSDIAWGISGEDALALHRKGEQVTAIVLDVDVEKERISLGMKQLEKGAPAAGVAAAASARCKQERSRHRHRARSARRRPRSAGWRRWRHRLHQAQRPWPRPRRTASRPLPGRPEVRRDGHRLRPFEEAQLLGQGASDRTKRRKPSNSTVRRIRALRSATSSAPR